MNDHFDLDELTKKTKRLEYEDGLRDFQLGLIFLIVGLANWFIFTPAGLEIFARTMIRLQGLVLPALGGFIGLIFLLAFGSERIMERIRRATFWRESGFVKPLRRGVVKNRIMVLATIVLLGIVIGSVWLMARGSLSQEVALRSIPASIGFSTAVIFISLGTNLGLRRYLIVGVTGFLLSTIIGIGWAVIFAISGAWALNGALRDLRSEALNG
jgi:hypothetical protein